MVVPRAFKHPLALTEGCFFLLSTESSFIYRIYAFYDSISFIYRIYAFYDSIEVRQTSIEY